MARIIENRKSEVDEYLTQIRQGDSSALDPLYESTSKPIYSLCYTYLHNKYDSEDALSETYLSVVKNIDKYKGEDGFNWIYTIAKHVSLNILRRKKKMVEVDFFDEETENALGVKEAEIPPRVNDESGIIALSEKVLSEKEFKIVILHAVNDMKFKDIAYIVGGLESTVRWQYNNALKKIKNAYERRSR